MILKGRAFPAFRPLPVRAPAIDGRDNPPGFGSNNNFRALAPFQRDWLCAPAIYGHVRFISSPYHERTRCWTAVPHHGGIGCQ
jgi:hypothetical protein